MSEEEQEPNKGGRPAFEPTPEQRDEVEIGATFGMSKAALAAALDIDVKTLTKHFEKELFNGHSKKRLESLKLVVQSAREGNASARKTYERLTAMGASGAPSGAQPERPEPAPTARKSDDPGKKEMLNTAARQAPPDGSKWSGLLN